VRPQQTQTGPRGGADGLLKQHYRELLEETRERTMWLVSTLTLENLQRVHTPLLSPLVWDLGHIAAFEDLWLCQQTGGLPALRDDLADIYDATLTPRAQRGDLSYLPNDEAREFMREVRRRAFDVLEAADVSPDADALTAGGFVWEMIARHEQQHNETMVQALRMAEPGVFSPHPRPLPAPPFAGVGPDMVRVDAGEFLMGAGDSGFAYDNERRRHEVHLDGFEIDRLPVTNGDFARFVEAGGYRRREWWSEEGWAWREAEGVQRPLFWTADGEERWFDRVRSLDRLLPVMHVSWYEADAYARSIGKRLPTEAEWEKAAGWDEAAGELREYPWGEEPDDRHANLDQTAFGPARAGAYPRGASPYGALGMVGDAWEWTASDFEAYPGFRAFPYKEYSAIFFGHDYKVLRGGSWATRPRVAGTTFRNWDYPQRRQIFCGFRCAA
jgi:iron(II)-dependent oxidoreductase